MVKVSKPYLQGEDTRVKGGSLKEMKDPTYQQNQKASKKEGGAWYAHWVELR